MALFCCLTDVYLSEMVGCAAASGLYLGLPVTWFLVMLPLSLKLFIQSIYLEITNSVLTALTIILGSRLVLSIRNFYADPSEEGSNSIQGTSAAPNHSFTQPSLPGVLRSPSDSSQAESTFTKGYHLNANRDSIV